MTHCFTKTTYPFCGRNTVTWRTQRDFQLLFVLFYDADSLLQQLHIYICLVSFVLDTGPLINPPNFQKKEL